MNKTQPGTQQKLIITTIFLLIIALSFNGMLSLGFIEKIYTDSVVSNYYVTGKDLQRNLNKSLRFGKSLQKFVGIDKILSDAKKNLLDGLNPEIIVRNQSDINIFIALSDGSIHYSMDNSLKDKRVPYEILKKQTKNNESKYIKHENLYIISLPLENMRQKTVGSVNISFDQKLLKHIFNKVLQKSAWIILIIVFFSGLFLTVILKKIKTKKKNKSYYHNYYREFTTCFYRLEHIFV